ncbi:MAG: LPXTG cell wall anchor domain-containing protein, partial [Candidatus Acidiferrales bacterium]
AITPEQNEEPLAEAVQTTPPIAADTTPAPAAATPAVETAELPKTASTVPLIGLLGLMSLGLALVVKRIA